MIAQTLVCWTQAPCLSDELAIAEPATLGSRLCPPAGGWSATPPAHPASAA
jgi:hypothetical protein